ncbi:MAG TPA: sigma 54-interacting transcriptional regulator [Terriglobales bacterium]|jgi:DNA-binding NtrC family response regulator|nr:sigma 54-interacting transcriptional regulator [Terriglobales bacterium]
MVWQNGVSSKRETGLDCGADRFDGADFGRNGYGGQETDRMQLHNPSLRMFKTSVKVNCTAILLGLLESEPFGHEKGTFTGARRIGHFEPAHQGTLFLDEIGNVPIGIGIAVQAFARLARAGVRAFG